MVSLAHGGPAPGQLAPGWQARAPRILLRECRLSVVSVQGSLEAARMWVGAGGLSHWRLKFYELETAAESQARLARHTEAGSQRNPGEMLEDKTNPGGLPGEQGDSLGRLPEPLPQGRLLSVGPRGPGGGGGRCWSPRGSGWPSPSLRRTQCHPVTSTG